MTVVTQVDLDTPLLGPIGKKAADRAMALTRPE